MTEKIKTTYEVDHKVEGGLIYTLLLWTFLLGFTGFVVVAIFPLVLFRAARQLHLAGHLWARVLVRLTDIHVEIEGQRHLYRGGPVILLCNHQSLLDVVALFNAIDVPFVFMAKSSLFKIPFFGWAMSAAGYIPVERGRSDRARKSLFKAADKVQNGRSVMIFPEATRGHPDGTMLPFKKGAFILAKKAQVYVQPITIYGANEVMPARQNTVLQRLRRGNTIRVVVHVPLEPEDYAGWSADELSRRVF